MELIVGKKYITECGYEVRIYASDGMLPFPIHGAYKKDNDWRLYEWESDGSNGIGDTSSLNIVSELNPGVNFHLSCIPAWH
jgi:hypothetical protein